MTPAAWIALAVGLASLLLNILALSVGYGVLKGTVQGLAARVSALESEVGGLSDLKVSIAEVRATVGFVVEQLRDLNAAVRWMRNAAAHETRSTQQVTP